MLLLLQVGSVKLGDVVRYTIIYSPSADRILPSPEKLYLRIRNTSIIALRAAFVHGPYSLSVAAYPSTFDPNQKFANARKYGVPEFEPMVKAGGLWECELIVPDEVRQTAGLGSDGNFGEGPHGRTVTWIVEVASQVLFSNSASVGFEVVLARDRKSLNWSYATAAAAADNIEHTHSHDYHIHHGNNKPIGISPTKGVFSCAISVIVEDTTALWNKPHVAGWSDVGKDRMRLADEVREERRKALIAAGKLRADEPAPKHRKKKIHLVIVTHGLHSNLGADMLFLKESIDAGAKKARADAKVRRAKERWDKQRREAGLKPSDHNSPNDSSKGDKSSQNESPIRETTASATECSFEDEDSDDDEEQVIVKGFNGNATRTERGIKFLGKRLARYVLALTYPDQPYHPEISRGAGETLVHALKGGHMDKTDGTKTGDVGNNKVVKGDHVSINSTSSHPHNSIKREEFNLDLDLPYKIMSISFVGHSLGGLIQTYAVAYIQKHSPQFFELIKPINFVALATPFLGLSNENPIYVKFALDFGLVGRTGQDLGLTWRPPTMARSGWSAIVSNLGETAHKKVLGESQPESKPLLRILPTGPAHTALRKFRNRTVYSNVVNDGIVPLRTSCLLFLDWQGLGRVEKARRGAGLVETVVAAGWAELTGAGMNHRTAPLPPPDDDEEDIDNTNGKTIQESAIASPSPQPLLTPLLGGEGNQHEVPQPSHEAMVEDDCQSLRSVMPSPHEPQVEAASAAAAGLPSPLSGLFALFKSHEPPQPQEPSSKQKLIYHRSQTISLGDDVSVDDSPPSDLTSPTSPKAAEIPQSRVTTGAEFESDGLLAPPRTTVFESAHDIINPKMPNVPYLIDPAKRARTIFHDRVYHPEDIPPPLMKKRSLKPKGLTRTFSYSKKNSVGGDSPVSPATLQASTGLSDSTVHLATEEKAKDAAHLSSHEPELVKESDDVNSANMRVEEKIARAYHRGLSWRKVLVKLEPDAHNNIIVRRMFPNAYGWPVVHHVVEAHFSDSASARFRVDDEHSRERALDLMMPPNKHGRETRMDSPASGSQHHSHLTLGVDPIALEASDSVPDLLPMRKTSRSTRNDPTSPITSATSPRFSNYDSSDWDVKRKDSMTWSDRDWHDSEPESDSGLLSPLPPASPGALGSSSVTTGSEPGYNNSHRSLEVPKSQNKLKKMPQGDEAASSGWGTWTEAIVGRRGKGKAGVEERGKETVIPAPDEGENEKTEYGVGSGSAKGKEKKMLEMTPRA